MQLGAQARALAESRTWESIMDGLLAQYAEAKEGRAARPAA
jgi:hypothetical protein